MAIAQVVFDMNWVAEVSEGSEIDEALLSTRSRWKAGSGPMRGEYDVMNSLLVQLPDEAFRLVSYRGTRENFKFNDICVTVEGLMVTIAPIPFQSKQEIVVSGTSHSHVRANFFAIWEGRRKPEDIDKPFVVSPSGNLTTALTLKEALAPFERAIILEALKANGWNRGKSAVALGINRTTLYNKMRQHALFLPSVTSE